MLWGFKFLRYIYKWRLGSLASQPLLNFSTNKSFSCKSFEISFLISLLFSTFFKTEKKKKMGFRFPSAIRAKQLIQRPSSNAKDIPKGFLAVYIADENNTKRFVIPMSYLNQPDVKFPDLTTNQPTNSTKENNNTKEHTGIKWFRSFQILRPLWETPG